jgi:cholesterol oxidase
LGTVSLLLKLKDGSLPNLSNKLGYDVRTNNESLIGVINDKNEKDFSKGVAIGSIVHTDENSHLEVVRYGKGSAFWRFNFLPLAYGKTFGKRISELFKNFFSKPWRYTKIAMQWNFTTKNTILLFMQTLDSTLKFARSGNGMKSTVQEGKRPTSFIPEAKELAKIYGEKTDGESFILFTETILGIPTTAHILGGCVIGEDNEKGVIDVNQKVFGYQNMWVVDGSAISANPGVNPSLTITAISEYAMDQIPPKA